LNRESFILVFVGRLLAAGVFWAAGVLITLTWLTPTTERIRTPMMLGFWGFDCFGLMRPRMSYDGQLILWSGGEAVLLGVACLWVIQLVWRSGERFVRAGVWTLIVSAVVSAALGPWWMAIFFEPRAVWCHWGWLRLPVDRGRTGWAAVGLAVVWLVFWVVLRKRYRALNWLDGVKSVLATATVIGGIGLIGWACDDFVYWSAWKTTVVSVVGALTLMGMSMSLRPIATQWVAAHGGVRLADVTKGIVCCVIALSALCGLCFYFQPKWLEFCLLGGEGSTKSRMPEHPYGMFPAFFVFAGFASLLTTMFALPRFRRWQSGLCAACGYDLRGTVEAGREACPECGEGIEEIRKAEKLESRK